MTETKAPTQYLLTRTKHQVAEGQPPQEPELLESYIDGKDGEMWTGGYLRHAIGESQLVPAHVAQVVMGDAGLRKHYTCEPPIAVGEPIAIEETHEGSIEEPHA